MFVQLASMQQPWRSIRGGGFAVRAQVNIQRGFFSHSVCYTCRYEYTEKRKGGNINYQVVERRDTVNTREDTKRGEKGGRTIRSGREGGGGTVVRQTSARGRSTLEFMIPVFRGDLPGGNREIPQCAGYIPWRNISRRYYARYDKNNTRKITVPR